MERIAKYFLHLNLLLLGVIASFSACSTSQAPDFRAAVADPDRRLGPLAGAQLRLGDDLRVGVRLEEVDHDAGDGSHEPRAGLLQEIEVVQRHRRAASKSEIDRLAGASAGAGAEQLDPFADEGETRVQYAHFDELCEVDDRLRPRATGSALQARDDVGTRMRGSERRTG